jgi:hypothetical protein
MREARFSTIPSVLVRIARDWNRDVLRYKRLAREAARTTGRAIP